jgi:hypothetical protein
MILGASFLITTVSCWGMDGHAIIAEIAERLLSQRTRSQALDIVGNASLASISDWADEYRHSPAGKWSGSLHYADLPDRVCVFEPTRDCISSRCVYGAVMNYTTRLQAYKGDMDLKFLVHLVGDAHQPLHAGFTSDRGGNEIHVSTDFRHSVVQVDLESQRDANLHAVWDEALLGQSEEELQLREARPGHHSWMRKADELFKQINKEIFAEIKSQCECPFNCALEILKESARLACDEAYHRTDTEWVKSGDQLKRDYYEARIQVIDRQLIKAGVRLSVLIENALTNSSSVSDTDDIFVFDA